MNRPPVHGLAKLVDDLLTITVERANGKTVQTQYRIRFIPIHPDIGRPPTWELQKIGGDSEVYHVHLAPWGWSCSCASFVFDHQNSDGICKHISAGRVTGLLRENMEWLNTEKSQDTPVTTSAATEQSGRQESMAPTVEREGNLPNGNQQRFTADHMGPDT